MNTNKILSLLLALFLMTGCDYNEEYFDGYDDAVITDLVQYEGDFTGNYPADGYFTDRAAMEKAVNTMLKAKFPYVDKGSTAKILVLFGDITPGFPTAPKTDEAYTLTTADYDSMGEEAGQPGKYNNFDSNMDVDKYLSDFCTEKYGTLAVGKTVAITYKYYAGTTTDQVKVLTKTASGWDVADVEKFSADIIYTLVTEDYDSMGTTSGTPGRYDNFDSNMDVDLYLTNFLRVKYPYAKAGQTASVTYKYYSGSATDRSNIYKYDGATWSAFNPYEDTLEVSTKSAEMEYDGTNWSLKRLMGGSTKITLVTEHYKMLLDWVVENKDSGYLSTQNNTDEYYFGSAYTYGNINNNYNTWKNYYNVGGQYDGLTNDQMQAIMDARMVEGITVVLLPAIVSNPDPGMTYVVVYKIYAGRGAGNYKMSFIYNEDAAKYEVTSDVSPE